MIDITLVNLESRFYRFPNEERAKVAREWIDAGKMDPVEFEIRFPEAGPPVAAPGLGRTIR